MVIISSDIGCFMLALFYLENLMGDIQYKIWFSIRVRGRILLHPQNFSVHLPFSIFFWSWTKIVPSVTKCKNLPLVVIISSDVGCFMLTLFYLENVMGDIQYKIWFSIRVRGGTPTLSVFLYTSPFQFFSLQLIWNCVFCQKM